MSDENELSEIEFVEALMNDFELTPEDSIADLIEALRNDEAADEGENDA